ncbi:hypothetical protein AU467_30220 [Mesorhizobium loti]|uniref:Uncharacterized protein n=1 Tax=Rhizobium loti TaxID=381 RepID=A0A117N233_RHILI|nr:hypothetical protein AU467_30220 [Mesorhizobium loti]
MWIASSLVREPLDRRTVMPSMTAASLWHTRHARDPTDETELEPFGIETSQGIAQIIMGWHAGTIVTHRRKRSSFSPKRAIR